MPSNVGRLDFHGQVLAGDGMPYVESWLGLKIQVGHMAHDGRPLNSALASVIATAS